MKSLKRFLTLALLIVSGMLLQTNSYGQGQPQKCLPLTRYDSLLVAVAEGTQAVIEAQTYKKEADALQAEVDRKEGVIVRQIEKNKVCYALADTLRAQISIKDQIIATERNTIKKLGSRPKMWAVSLMAGYGYSFSSEVKRAPFVGIGISKALFRF